LNAVLGWPTKAVRLGATGLRAGFSWLTNPTRDLQTFAVQSTATNGMPHHVIKGFWDASHDTGIRQLWRASGGEMAQPLGLDRKMVQNLVDEAMANDVKSKAMNIVKHPLDAVRELFSLPEAGPRLAEFNAVLKKYDPMIEEAQARGDVAEVNKLREDAAIEATNLAADVTVNFRRAGVYGQALNQVIPFFNPSIQGAARTYRMIRSNPKRALIHAVSAITVPTLALWYLHKDEDWYKALPLWEKYGYWHFKMGDKIFRLPKPFEWGYFFGALPEAGAQSYIDNDPKAFVGAVDATARAVNPVDWPAVIGPMIEAESNWDTFRKAPIVSRSLEDLLPSEQYTPNTSAVAKRIGKILDYPPAKVDHLLSGYTGGLVNDLLNVTKKDIKENADIPVVGRLFLRSDAIGLGSQQVKEFYNLLDESSRVRKTIDHYWEQRGVKTPQAAHIQLAAQQLGIDDGVQLYAIFKTANTTAIQLKGLRKKQQALNVTALEPEAKKRINNAVGQAGKQLAEAVLKLRQAATKVSAQSATQ
jgi:hypothetical protein